MSSTQWTPVSCSLTLNFLSAPTVEPLQTYTGTSTIRYQKQSFLEAHPSDHDASPSASEVDEDRAYFHGVRQRAAETIGLHLYAYTEKHSLFPPKAIPLVLEGIKVAAMPSGKSMAILSLKDAEVGKEKPAAGPSATGKPKGNKADKKKAGKQTTNVEKPDAAAATVGATMQDVGSKLVYFEKEEELTVGAEVELRIQFKGTIQEADVGGIYCRALKDAEEQAAVLLTHFEVHLARIAFPCPDHPQYRVLWELKSVQLPAAYHTMRSNGCVQEERHLAESTVYQFGRVGPLPAYVFAFAAFSGPPIEEVETVVTGRGGTGGGADLPLRVAAAATSHVPPEMLLYVQRIASEAVVYLEDFFQSPLPLLGCPELVVLCVPTMPFISGMEHHGCIFLNEDIYKTPSGKGAAAAKKNAEHQKIAQTELIIHEIIHHWIGNALGLPFAIKEGICLLLEQCFGDVVLGKPMRKIVAAPGAGLASNSSNATSASKGAAAAAPATTHKTEEGKEFTGHSYQLALASLQQVIGTIGFAAFQNKMRRLLAVHLQPVLQEMEEEGGVEGLRLRGAYMQMPYLSTEEFLSFLSSDEKAE